MTDSQILKTARKILPLLDGLLGAKAPAAKRELQRLLAQAKKGVKAAPRKILDLLNSYPAVRKWMRENTVPPRRAKAPAAAGLLPPVGAPSKGPKASGIRPPGQRAKPPLAMGGGRPARRGGGGDIAFGGIEDEAPAPKLPYDVVTIHFATDRQPSGKTEPSEYFTGNRSKDEQMTYGTCDVSIPFGHKKGTLEGPSWLKFEFQEDPQKHVVLLKVSALDVASFFASASKGAPQALVFVHGFRVTFEDGARRMAQIARDLDPFVALPILYSWPSRGKLASYMVDHEAAEWTAPHLQQFLEDLVVKSGIETVHIIAHSMGNQAVTLALEKMAASAKTKVKLHQVLLTAPDVDAGLFKQRAKAFLQIAQRVTLYANSEDKALIASKKLQGFPRAGDASEILVLGGMDSVDATNVDNHFFGLNHSYVGDVRTVITDLRGALQGLAVNQRDLKEITSAAGVYYRFAS